ncbi:hypothetical protein D3C87_1466310 [compost metagenome]
MEIKLRLRTRAHFLALFGLRTEIERRGIGSDGEKRAVAGAHAQRPEPAFRSGIGVGRKPCLSRRIALFAEGVGVTCHIGCRRLARFRFRNGAAAIGVECGENALASDVAIIVALGRHGIVAVTDDGIAFALRIRHRVADFRAEFGIRAAINGDACG